MSHRPFSNNKVFCLSGSHGKEYLDSHAETELDKLKLRSQQYQKAFLQLKLSGYEPDVVLWHTGWGCGMHINNVWPKAHCVGYLEWWFSDDSPIELYEQTLRVKTVLPHQRSKNAARNDFLQRECENADLLVCPTYWQLSQFPAPIACRAHVIHEGVDYSTATEYGGSKSRSPLITYGTRGMEPMREFELFVHELSHFLPRHPDVKVEIVGEDKPFYSGRYPFSDHPTWGTWAVQTLTDANVSDQVSFLGRLEKPAYLEWLRSSWLHLYLTRPFVVGWSLLDSLACGTITCATDLPVTREVMHQSGVFVDTRSTGWLETAWHGACNPEIHRSVTSRSASRALRYDSKRTEHALRSLCQRFEGSAS